MKKFVMLILIAMVAVACNKATDKSENSSKDVPVYTLALNVYPSSSKIVVAAEKGLVDKHAGKQSPMEKSYGVDLVIKETDYGDMLTLLSSGKVDAAIIVQFDALSLSTGQNLVIVSPISESVGADAWISIGKGMDDLKGVVTRGEEKTVSQYLHESALAKFGKSGLDYPFANIAEPEAVSGVLTGQKNFTSVVAWNPGVTQILKTVKDSTVIYSSVSNPKEIIDVLVVRKEVLDKPGGEAFVRLILDTYFRINTMMDDPKTGDELWLALADKYGADPANGKVNIADMKALCQATRCYKSPKEALALFNDKDFRDVIMPKVAKFCFDHGMTAIAPNIGWDNKDAGLNFSTKYLETFEVIERLSPTK